MSEQITTQAKQDARDAFDGFRVWPPYPESDPRLDIWREAFEAALELLVMEDKR
jgi:hypothetical protein